jgi:type II secretory pathway component GspD/PulD (secretin)
VPTSQVSYEDIGLVLKATPRMHGDLITLEYEMSLRSLSSSTVNSLPIMNSRDMKGVISTSDGLPIIIAGLVDSEEQKSMSGIPGISEIPGLGDALDTKAKSKTYNELMVILTPHLTAPANERGFSIPMPALAPK